MAEPVVNLFLSALGYYILAGLLFSIFFYAKGGSRLDEGYKGTPWHFKLILFPGLLLFWLPLLIKYLRK